MSDDLLKRLETGHDKECAMSYGMHEHCCDCSYPARQEAAARVRELEAERDALTKKLAGLEQYRSRDQLAQRVLRAEAERDALRSRNEVLGDQLDAINDDLTNIMAERDALRDALERVGEWDECPLWLLKTIDAALGESK